MEGVSLNQSHDKRKLSNYLLQPLVQVKLGLYAVVLAFSFCLSLVWLVYLNLYSFYDLVLELTDLRDEMAPLLEAHLQDAIILIIGSALIYFLLTLAVSIFFTHRLVGPTYAFRRHIKELSKGNFSSRICLRKSDAFSEVAEDLNKLASDLETRQQRQGGL